MRSRITQLIPMLGLAAALGLVGCAGTDTGTVDVTTDDTTVTDTTTDDTTVTDADVADEGVWIVTGINYPLASEKLTLDEHGNVIKDVSTVVVEDANDTVNIGTFTYGDDGHLAKVESETDGKSDGTATLTVEVDDEGRIVSEKEDGEDGATYTYEYDGDGNLTKMTIAVKGFETVNEYEDGLLVAQASDGYKATITYTKDANGTPTKALLVADSELGHEENEITFELDADGNIAKSTTKTLVFTDTDGKEDLSDTEDIVITYEYQFVDAPSIDAKVHAQHRLANALVHS